MNDNAHMIVIPSAHAGITRALHATFPAAPPRLPTEWVKLLDQLP